VKYGNQFELSRIKCVTPSYAITVTEWLYPCISARHNSSDWST